MELERGTKRVLFPVRKFPGEFPGEKLNKENCCGKEEESSKSL